jgi:hypothetical protein
MIKSSFRYYCIGYFFKFHPIIGVEESIENALYRLWITDQLFKTYVLHEWCVHSRLSNAYYEVKFKKHPIYLQYVHELSYKEEKKIFLIFQKKPLLIKWSVCFQASKAVFIFALAISILFLFAFISQIWTYNFLN